PSSHTPTSPRTLFPSPTNPSLPSIWTFFFFSNDTSTTELYTLSLHDALPISLFIALKPPSPLLRNPLKFFRPFHCSSQRSLSSADRKSTRLNSSHVAISYAVFCLKKKD